MVSKESGFWKFANEHTVAFVLIIIFLSWMVISVFEAIFTKDKEPMFSLDFSNGDKETHWREHSRCYYFNDKTECGKTRFCATHVSEEFCNEVGGEWLLETRENEARDMAYWFAKDGEKEQ